MHTANKQKINSYINVITLLTLHLQNYKFQFIEYTVQDFGTLSNDHRIVT
jgi:hypothetical protein